MEEEEEGEAGTGEKNRKGCERGRKCNRERGKLKKDLGRRILKEKRETKKDKDTERELGGKIDKKRMSGKEKKKETGT